MTPKKYSDQHIIKMIRQRNRETEKVFKHLYQDERRNQTIRKVVNRWSALRNDYEDILQEVFEAIYKSIIKRKFDESRPLQNYVIGTAKNICSKRSQKLSKIRKEKELKILRREPPLDSQLIQDERRQLYLTVLEKLGPSCSKILMKAFLEGYKNQELVDIMEYKNEAVVRKKKCNCLKRLNALIEERPELKKLMKDEH